MGDTRTITTTIQFDIDTWRMLARLARLKAERFGGRPSQSKVVRELIRDAAKQEGRRARS
jgi:hypothetical protein